MFFQFLRNQTVLKKIKYIVFGLIIFVATMIFIHVFFAKKPVSWVCSKISVFIPNKLKDGIINSSVGLLAAKIRDGKSIDADHVVTRLDNGMEIIVNKHDRCVCYFIRLTGHWDSAETTALKKIIQPGFKIVEVGSNFGVHTLRMAELVGNSGHIDAFEANPHVSKYLKQSVALNHLDSRVTVFESAVSNTAYTGFMIYGLSNIGGGYILPNNKTSRLICQTSTCTPIQVNTLDSLLGHTEVNLLKIDAEGAEYWILEGAKKLLQNNPDLLLMLEWSASHIRRNQIKISDFVELLKQNQFNYIYKIASGGHLEEISYKTLWVFDYGTDIDIILSKKPIKI
jgi:FkbM family methyltransferase